MVFYDWGIYKMMRTTAGINLTNHTIGEAYGVEKHNKRELENDPNVTINDENSELNRSRKIDAKENLHERIKDEVNEKNKKVIKNYVDKKYSRKQFEKNYIVDDYDYMSRGTGKSPNGKLGVASLVLQIGGTTEYKKFLKNENIPFTFDEKKGFTYPDKDKIKEVADLYNATYEKLHEEFLKSDAFMEFSYDLHMDEGYPHVHDQLLNNGTTKTGNKSFSSNQSIAKFLEFEGLQVATGSTASKQNMRTFREFTDNFLVDEFNKNLQKSKFKTRDVELVRTDDEVTGATPKRRKNAMQKTKEEWKKNAVALQKAKVEAQKAQKLAHDRQVEAEAAWFAEKAAKDAKKKAEEEKEQAEAELEASQRDADDAKSELLRVREETDRLKTENAELKEQVATLKGHFHDINTVVSSATVLEDTLKIMGVPDKNARYLSRGVTMHTKSGKSIDAGGMLINRLGSMTEKEKVKVSQQSQKKYQERKQSKTRNEDNDLEL